ncbi:hypothetical protein WG66_008860, partial [Moniliophthora roreri]
MLLRYALAWPMAKNLTASNSFDSLFDPTTGECININGCRTITGIIWSCLSVILVCTWVTIHPDVPREGTGSSGMLFTRLNNMVVALIAPDLIILQAMQQWSSAQELARKYEKYGWGMPHAFLVLMGGFTLYDGDKFCGYLYDNAVKGYEPSANKYWHQIQEYHQRVQEVFG